MSSFLSALHEQDQKSDHGWSQANLFSSDPNGMTSDNTGDQMFTSSTPDSQSMGSLEGWSENGVVVEEVIQDDFITSGGHVFGANASESLQTFADASYGNQFLNGSYDNADDNISPPTVNEPITQVLGSLSEDKTFTTNDGQVLEPSTVLTSEGAYSTFNVMVSPDGTLVHSATDNNMATSEGYVYLNANNALGISPSSSVVPNTNVATMKNTSHAAVTMATKTASNIVMAPYTTIALTTNSGSTVVQAPNTTIAMTTNHFSGGTVLSQNTMIPSPVKTSNVILIPKVSAGKDSHQIVTLNNETLQAYIKGNKQLFSSPQKFTYSAGSKLKTGVNQVHAFSANQQSTSNDTSPKLTSLLKGSLADQISIQTPLIPQTNVLPVTVRPTTQHGQANNQTVVCDNIKDNLLKIVNKSQPQLVSTYDGKSVVVQLDKFGIKNQNTVPSGQHVSAVQGQYVTTLTTNNAGNLTKNVIKGNSNILCGSSSQNILAAISSGMKLSQSNNATSSNPQVTYFITTSTPSNNPVMTSGIYNKDTPKRGRGRGRGVRGRGRGRIAKAPSVGGSQYIIVQKGEIQTLPSKVISDLNIQQVQNNSSGALSMTQNVSNSQTTTNTDLIDLITSPSKFSDSATTTSTESQQFNGNSVQSQLSEKCINKKFVRCKDGGDLISGTTYLVSGPNGLQQKMLFNGENFVDPTTELSSPDQVPDGSMIGGGRKLKPLKGNAIGLNMTRENDITDADSNTTLPNCRPWKYTDPPNASNLARPPLHPTQAKEVASESSPRENTSQTSDVSVGSEQTEPDEISTEYVAVCKYCGVLSNNLTKCQRCFRIFPKEIKLRPVTETQNRAIVIDKGKFYSNKISEQASVYGGYTVKHIEEGKVVTGRTVKNLGKQYKLVHTRKLIVPQEPVTVTISSDEDEPETNEKPPQPPQPTVSNSKETVNSEPDELSNLVSVIPLKRSASPTFNKGSRISRMENKDGQPVRKVRRKSVGSDSVIPIRTVCTKTAVIDSKLGTTEELRTETMDHLAMDCRNIRVGSLKGTPIEPVIISSEAIELFMEGEEDSHRIRIHSNDVIQCLLGKKINIIFLQTSAEAGVYVRETLGMHEQSEGKPYFSPIGSDYKHFYITFFLSDACKVNAEQLHSVFQSYEHYKKGTFLVELDEPATQKFLLKTAPSISNKTSEAALQRMVLEKNKINEGNSESRATTPADDTEQADMERSPSSPRILFSGPIEKLITYPPPPATGGITITNEDLFCLTDGEFLNDVIIDFYLKYLVHEKLSEADRKRTHVFSSFFFKRLTQRINRNTLDAHDTDLSLPEKRHARVKKWTKHVDLFEKDFIIVPINERSHWFLAVICFPGIKENRRVRYICKPKEEKPTNGEANTDKGDNSEKETTESEEKPTEVEDKEKSNDTVVKEESPMKEEEEQDTKDNEEPMETDTASNNGNDTTSNNGNDTTSNNGNDTTSNNGNDSPEPRGRLLTEEDLDDPEISSKAMEGLQQPCIMVMDSLAGQSRQRIINVLKDYLQVEWNSKKSKEGSIREKFKGASPKVPQQTNYSDCGVYILQYVDSFFEDPIFNFTFPMKSLTNWFTEERVSKKREEIRDLVMKLKEKYDNEKLKKS